MPSPKAFCIYLACGISVTTLANLISRSSLHSNDDSGVRRDFIGDFNSHSAFVDVSGDVKLATHVVIVIRFK